MGSGIALRKDSSWLPANWVGQAMVDAVLPFLEESDCENVRTKIESIRHFPGSVALFESANDEEINILLSSLSKARIYSASEGPVGWNKPEMFPVFLKSFDELIRYVESDRRISGDELTELEFKKSDGLRVTFFES